VVGSSNAPNESCSAAPLHAGADPGTMRLEPERRGEPRHDKEHAPDQLKRLRDMRAPWLWTNATVILLGFWLVRRRGRSAIATPR